MSTREITLHDSEGDELLVECDCRYGAPWAISVTATVDGSPLVMGVAAYEHRFGLRAGRIDAMVRDYFAWA